MLLNDMIVKKKFAIPLRVSDLALNIISQGVIISASDGRIIWVNDAFSNITGYTREEVIGQTCHFLQGPGTNRKTVETMRHAIRTYQEFNGEILNYRKSGDSFWNDMVIFPSFDRESQLSHFIAIIRDITERKLAEEQLRIAAVAFEIEEAIIITDGKRLIQRVNQSFVKITGFAGHEVVATEFTDFFRESLSAETFDVWDVLSVQGFWEGEFTTYHKSGRAYPVWLRVTAVNNEENVITHYVITFSDITVHKQAEKVFEEARLSLEKKVAVSQGKVEKFQQENLEINSVLNILIKHRESDITDSQIILSDEIESTILPFLKKLKTLPNANKQTATLVDIIQDNLKKLVKSYGMPEQAVTIYRKLSPSEVQVATLVKQGLSTKAIANLLSCSTETVNIHRKHIRKKFGLPGKGCSLRSFLLSLSGD